MKYQEEKIKDYVEEIIPLMYENNEEINLFGEEWNPDFEVYHVSEQNESLKTYTVRTEDNKLVGYCLFFLYNHCHHKHLRVAHQDVIYVSPEYRTCGLRLLRYTEKRLKELGVDIILQAAPKISRLSKVLERMGYDELEKIYVRRL